MNIILYVMDSMRPDFLSCYGCKNNTSPNIDRIAKDGVIFQSAFSTSSWTKPAATSIVTGLYPQRLKMSEKLTAIKGYKYLLQKILKKCHLKTYVFSSNSFFSAFGLAEGFDCEHDLETEDKLKEQRKRVPIDPEVAKKMGFDEPITTVVLSEDLNEYLFREVDFSYNNFILFWSMDTHDPYFVRGEKSFFRNSFSDFVLAREVNSRKFKTRNRKNKLKALYCDMIRYNDDNIGKLVAYLKEKKVYKDTLFILTGDHGEAFGEHGKNSHAKTVYNEQIKIPLIIKFPQNHYSGSNIYENVSICDIYPTILNLLNIKIDHHIDGESLLSYLKNDSKQKVDREIYAENTYNPNEYSGTIIISNLKYIRVELRGNVIKNLLKRIRNFPYLLYERQFNLEQDPHEKKLGLRIDKELRVRFNELRREYNQQVADFEISEGQIDEEVIKRLKALGYM